MSDDTEDLDARLNNIEESVELLQEQIDMIIETIESAMPKLIVAMKNNPPGDV